MKVHEPNNVYHFFVTCFHFSFQALEAEIAEKQPIQESVTATSAKLAEFCEADIDEMMAKVDDMNKNWSEMNAEKANKDEELQKMMNDLSEYEKRANAVEEKINKTEKTLPVETALVLDLPQMRNNLANVKNAKEQLEAVKPQLDSTVAYGNELLAQDPEIDGSNVKRRNQELEDLYNNVDEKVQEEAKKIQDLVDQMEQYAKSSKDLRKDLTFIHDEVEANKPGQLDMESLKEKDDSVKVSHQFQIFALTNFFFLTILYIYAEGVGTTGYIFPAPKLLFSSFKLWELFW
jgi:DNA repair exonuclease SbcCD ATPase subunit